MPVEHIRIYVYQERIQSFISWEEVNNFYFFYSQNIYHKLPIILKHYSRVMSIKPLDHILYII